MAQKWPCLAARVTVASGANVIRVEEEAGLYAFDVTITPGDYYLAEDDTQTGSLGKAIRDALIAGSSGSGAGNDFSVTYNGLTTPGANGGRVIIATDGGDLEILGAHANTTFDLATIGFAAASSGSAISLTGTLTPWATWCGNQPLVDDLHKPSRLMAEFSEAPGGQTFTFSKGSRVRFREDFFAFICEDRITTNLASTAALYYAAFEEWWFQTVADGRPFRLYWTDELSSGVLNELTSSDLIGTYVRDERHKDGPPPWTMVDDARLYNFTLHSREYKS